MTVVKRTYNPSSFARELTPEHKIWVQSVHKAISDLLNGVTALQSQMLKLQLATSLLQEEVKKSGLSGK